MTNEKKNKEIRKLLENTYLECNTIYAFLKKCYPEEIKVMLKEIDKRG